MGGNTIHTAILGTGSYVPPKVISNYDLEQLVDTTDEWIQKRVGISERRIADEDMASSDLGAIAAQRALDDAGISANDVDLVICSTVTGDMAFPSTACLISNALGIVSRVPAMDIGAACAGFCYGMHTADAFIRSGAHKTILLVAAEILTRYVDWTDRATCVLFGDAAGAMVLGASEVPAHILHTQIGAESLHADPELLAVPAGGSRRPASHETVDAREHYIKMEGRRLFKIAVSTMPEVARLILDEAGISADEIDTFILHQMNVRIMEAFADRLGVPVDKLLINVDKYGNTSSASTILAFDEARRNGRLKPGDRVFFLTFGAGWTWGASIVQV